MDKLTRVSDNIVRVEKEIPATIEVVEYDLDRIKAQLEGLLSMREQFEGELADVNKDISEKENLLASLEKAEPLKEESIEIIK